MQHSKPSPVTSGHLLKITKLSKRKCDRNVQENFSTSLQLPHFDLWRLIESWIRIVQTVLNSVVIKRETISTLTHVTAKGGAWRWRWAVWETDHTPHLTSPPLRGHRSSLSTSPLVAWLCFLCSWEHSSKRQKGASLPPTSSTSWVRLIYSSLSPHAPTHVWHTSLRTRVSPKSPREFIGVGMDLRRTWVTSLASTEVWNPVWLFIIFHESIN